MKAMYLYTKILVTGGIVLGLELASSRIMTPFFGVSLYVWSGILSVTLTALALGYKGGGMLTARAGADRTLLLFGAAGALAALWLDVCLWTYPYLFWPLADFNLVAGSIAACLYLLFIPLVILSALNPMLVALLHGGREEGGAKANDRGAGNVFFVSTIGSVLGVFAVAYGMLPHMTNYQAVGVLTLASALLSLGLLLKIRDFGSRMFRRLFATTVLACIVTIATLASGGLERFTHNVTFKGMIWHVVKAEPSSFGHLQIVHYTDMQNRYGPIFLLNDGMVQNDFYSPGFSMALYTYALEKLAFAAAPDARKALVLGIGGGVVPSHFAEDDLDVEAVDINRKMVELAKSDLGFDQGAIKISIQDARTAARHCRRDNDIVAVDLFRGDGIPEHLVTREFFSDIKNCMSDKGALVMNSFMKTDAPQAEYALIQTVASVFGEVYFVQPPAPNEGTFTSGFIVARKGGAVGPMDVSYSGVPPGIVHDLVVGVRDAKLYKANDPALLGAPVLTDVSNQWKQLAWPAEVSFRRLTVSQIPWQILMN